MQVTSNTSDSVHVSWQPPLNPYGNVTHYVISGSEHIDYVKPDRNFCNERKFGLLFRYYMQGLLLSRVFSRLLRAFMIAYMFKLLEGRDTTRWIF